MGKRFIIDVRDFECPFGKQWTTPASTPPPPPKSTAPWPLAVKLIAKMRKPDDVGVGDTLARVFNVIPVYRDMGAGDAFKTLMATIGVGCGCGDSLSGRQGKLNERFPYPKAERTGSTTVA
jgi:hypothetical protein